MGRGHASAVHLQLCLLSERPVEDTHLHATLQRLLEQVEVRAAHDARRDNPERVPNLDRQGIIDVVREVQSWHPPKTNQNLPYFIISQAAPRHLLVCVGWCVCVCVCVCVWGVTHPHIVEHHTFIEVHDPFYFPGVVVIEPRGYCFHWL